MRTSRWAVPISTILLAFAWFGCDRPDSPRAPASKTETPATVNKAASAPPIEPPGPIRFIDVTDATKIDFVHRSGANPRKDYPTLFGSGIALLDYDGDGRLDIYFATNRELPLNAPSRSKGNRLYRNLGDGTFEDVTVRAGVGFRGFTGGVAVGDVDNDGFPDLFLANLGTNVLYLNNGDGTFRDATAGSGLERESRWSTAAAFCDIDNDGDLDLYVARYTLWNDSEPHAECRDSSRGVLTVCSPTTLAPDRHALYRNNGDGTFDDVAEAAGVARNDGRGLGVIATDLNLDGKIDLFVTNDLCPNFIFLNKGNGTFEDVTDVCGAARSAEGADQSGMGIDAEDVDGDGFPELILSHFRGEFATFYKNLQGGSFADESYKVGIVADTKPYVGWGCALADLDNDGFLDLMIVNGHVEDNLEELGRGIPQAEPSLVWRGDARGRFKRSRGAGSFFATDHVARSAAFGDWDDDGRLDVVVGLVDRRPAVLRNVSPEKRTWIRLDLLGGRSNRSSIGARVEVRAGGRVWKRQVKGGGSYYAANDPRLLIGLDRAEKVDRVIVDWPSGARSERENLAVGRTHLLREPR